MVIVQLTRIYSYVLDVDTHSNVNVIKVIKMKYCYSGCVSLSELEINSLVL